MTPATVTSIEDKKRPTTGRIDSFESFPDQLTACPQWVLWSFEYRNGAWTKVLKQTSGQNAKSTNPKTWTTFDEAVKTYNTGSFDGVGFVFTENDDFVGIDLDGVLENGELKNEELKRIVDAFDSYTEISPRGSGLHIIIKGKKPDGAWCNKKINNIGFECYDKERFFTFTGRRFKSSLKNVETRQHALDWFINEIGRTEKPVKAQKKTNRPILTDERIIQLASRDKGGEEFKSLFAGDYTSRGFDESVADIVFCNHLAYYTGDAAQMLRIVNVSGLWREKWEREDYADRTIMGAINTCTSYYTEKTYKAHNVPVGYAMDDDGVYKIVMRKDEVTHVKICGSPVVIERRLENIQTGRNEYVLGFYDGHKWKTLRVAREDVLNARAIVNLSAFGFPVTSSDAGELSKFILMFEQANIDIPRDNTSNQFGWINNGFLLGNTPIGDVGTLTFSPSDAGDQQLADGIKTSGTLAGWLEGIAPIAAHAHARLALYAAFTAPLMAKIKCDNFVLDFANRTSTGKTTIQRVAASTFGNPDERSGSSTLHTWDSTKVWIERAAATMNGLPLILDDTKRFRYKQQISEILYDYASGKERQRGNVKGFNATRSWRGVMISSGETPATSYRGRDGESNGGTKTRTLTVSGVPLGTTDDAARKKAEAINKKIINHYGHAMPIFIDYLLKTDFEFEKDIHFDVQIDIYADKAPNAEGARLAKYMAAIYFASVLAHKAFEANGTPLPFPWRDPFGELLEQVFEETADVNNNQKAIETLQSWVTQQNSMFFGGHKQWDHAPIGGWYGKITKEFVAIYPKQLEQFFKDFSFNQAETLRLWRETGVLRADGRHLTYPVKIDGVLARLYVIPRGKLDRFEHNAYL